MTTATWIAAAGLVAGTLLGGLGLVMMWPNRGTRRSGRHVATRINLADAHDVFGTDDEPGDGDWASEPGPSDVPGDEEPIEQPAPFDPLSSPMPESVLAELRLCPGPVPAAPADVFRTGFTGELARLDDEQLAEMDAGRAAA